MLKVYTDYERPSEIKTFDPVVKVVDGKKVVLYEERVEDPNVGLKASDFSIQSLLDADAVDLLQPVGPITRSLLYASDIANYIADSIGYNIDVVSSQPVEEKNKNNDEEK